MYYNNICIYSYCNKAKDHNYSFLRFEIEAESNFFDFIQKTIIDNVLSKIIDGVF